MHDLCPLTSPSSAQLILSAEPDQRSLLASYHCRLPSGVREVWEAGGLRTKGRALPVHSDCCHSEPVSLCACRSKFFWGPMKVRPLIAVTAVDRPQPILSPPMHVTTPPWAAKFILSRLRWTPMDHVSCLVLRRCVGSSRGSSLRPLAGFPLDQTFILRKYNFEF